MAYQEILSEIMILNKWSEFKEAFGIDDIEEFLDVYMNVNMEEDDLYRRCPTIEEFVEAYPDGHNRNYTGIFKALNQLTDLPYSEILVKLLRFM